MNRKTRKWVSVCILILVLVIFGVLDALAHASFIEHPYIEGDEPTVVTFAGISLAHASFILSTGGGEPCLA